MIAFPMLTIYAVFAYVIWWTISRLGLLGGWIYSKPGTITIRHWVLILFSLIPFVMEIISTMLVIFGLAFGLSHTKEKDDY